MSDPKQVSVTTSKTVTETVTTTDAELAKQLVADATKANVKYKQDDERADHWGKDSFPASDPPQNY